MQQTCHHCKISFIVRPEDLGFYKEIDVPPPTLCYICRMQRRLSFRSERFLYHRKCDLTGKQMISSYSTDKSFPVYDIDAWWSDKWDAKAYGRELDFSRPFFEQFFEMRNQVPRMARIQQKPMENSEYCNAAGHSKNCYLCFSTNTGEDCYFGTWLNRCKSCVDATNVNDSELCYECVNCTNCYDLQYSRDCKNCNSSMFLRACIGCTNCFGCYNQIQKQYMIFNEQKTKEEYEAFMMSLKTGSFSEIEAMKERFNEFSKSLITKEFDGTNNENSVGNYLNNCKNVYYGFECENVEDISYSMCIYRAKNAMDHSYWGDGTEKTYECQACGYGGYNLRFCNLCWSNCSDLTYCDQMFSSKNCFGCIGLRQAEYCVFNKQYSKEEYEKLVQKITTHMKETKEFGEFFPTTKSHYAYNETLAYEQIPLTKEEVLERKWRWKDEEENNSYKGPNITLPDSINDVSDEITKNILVSTLSGKPFKIIPQELAFYRTHQIPLPRLTPNERHYARLQMRNKRVMYDRICTRCKQSIITTYSPDRLEQVYCEKCYLETIY